MPGEPGSELLDAGAHAGPGKEIMRATSSQAQSRTSSVHLLVTLSTLLVDRRWWGASPTVFKIRAVLRTPWDTIGPPIWPKDPLPVASTIALSATPDLDGGDKTRQDRTVPPSIHTIRTLGDRE